MGIGCRLDDPLNAMIPSNPDYDGFTYYFPERSRQVRLEPLIKLVPADIRLVQPDERLFTKSFDYVLTLEASGTVDNVMQQTLGVIVLEGDTIVCEAATGAPTRGRIEVGVTTAEAYRQRGFAIMACASLIRECEAMGYSTWWDCAEQSLLSLKLAQKLGYTDGRKYRYVWWARR